MTQREQDRQTRKAAMARAQAEQFEDEISGHELNLLRLDIIPKAQRDESWDASYADATGAIELLGSVVEVTLAEADNIARTPVSHEL